MANHIRPCLAPAVALLIAMSTLGAQPPKAVRLPGYLAPMPLDSGVVNTTIPASAGAVFWAARQVFFELNIPTPMADSAWGYLVNARFIKLRSLAGSALSVYLNCGLGMTGPNADSFRVTMAIAALIDSTEPNAARFRLTLLAGAESTEGVAKSAVACGSTGVLEQRILRAVQIRVRR